MITLVLGGSGSGKSEFAENLLSENEIKYYIATMIAYGEEGKSRVKKHRKNRQGKDFVTIEKTIDVCDITHKIASGDSAILECVSNLVANEMFDAESEIKDEKNERVIADKIIADISALSSVLSDFVLVTNNIFEDGVEYDDETKRYMRVLAMVNESLANIADAVYEVVVGIPIKLK